LVGGAADPSTVVITTITATSHKRFTINPDCFFTGHLERTYSYSSN
jgi:hypothetical protein